MGYNRHFPDRFFDVSGFRLRCPNSSSNAGLHDSGALSLYLGRNIVKHMDSISDLSLSELLDDAFTDDDGRLILDEGDAFLLEGVEQLTPQLLERIMCCMLFALPHEVPWGSVVVMPNPVSRYCIDLRVTPDRPPVNWFRSRKFQKYARDFTLVVKTDLRSDLQVAKSYHESRSGGTWITDELMQLLQLVSGSRDVVQCFSFSLVTKSGGETAAVCLGFACGGVYQDYTMCTPLRDHRSCGSLLSRIVCAVLQQIGIDVWYWGYRMEYMEEYASYGARDFGRQEFNEVLRQRSGAHLLPLTAVKLPDIIALDIQVPAAASSAQTSR